MIFPSNRLRILVATRPVDFRKGHDGLAALVQSVLRKDPFTGTVFVFRSRRADRLKLLYWDGSGLVLTYKRLEDTSFTWPAIKDGMMALNHAQFEALFAGLDWRRVANEVLKAQTAKVKLARMKGELVDRARTTTMVFDLARRERDAWQNWPARVAANMAADLGVDAHRMEQVLDNYLRQHLADLAEVKIDLR
ncbi:IS66 family insertion sequence element accessory protein TnpB [Paracoccus marinaquae]|uniref:IS66 family insertion sequence element accessory protein TnpB n=1 Tax=Paracoccus marinaquae TaxID=2841926 RepID=A0ABS6AGI6_9RHOB|nr:IS66 family insertion sequence element accessory protein TnpB [Paracoccus marinaquae]MBU3029699.1 IS66 family insertion sequence element accessory protein TnpB [Paracoccus marinaquae]